MPALHPLGRCIARASYRVNSQLRENQRAGWSYALTRALISNDAAMRGSAITRPQARSAFYRWTAEKWDKYQPSRVNDCSKIGNKDDGFVWWVYAPFTLPANEKLLCDVTDSCASRALFTRMLTSDNCIVFFVFHRENHHVTAGSESSHFDENRRY